MKFKDGWKVVLYIGVIVFIIGLSISRKSLESSNATLETESVVEETNAPASVKMVGNTEFIGCSRENTVTSPVTFYYYRDVVTDQMFLVSYTYNNHSIVPMLNPKTGLPLSYSEYKNMEDAKFTAKEGTDVANND